MSRFGMDVVDGDGHVVERRADLERFGFTAPATDLIDMLLAWDRGSWGGQLKPAVDDGAFVPSARLGDMDKEGIEHSVNFPTALLGVSDFPDPAASASACRAFNDWFANTYRTCDPGRFSAVALVPLRDGEFAAAEARQAIVELGAVGVMTQPYVGDDVHLCDAQFDPLWATLEELEKPVAIHGSRHTCPPKLTQDDFRNAARFYAMSHPFQQQVAMADLVLGGVLERFPRLKVVFLESGIGWMPYFIDRLDEAYESVREDWIDKRWALTREPSKYVLSGNCWFSCEPDEPYLAHNVDALGEDQVIFASDYPHFDCKYPDSARELIEASGLRESTVKKVAGVNARALYGL
ncbi:MAG: amidohydrolase [Actinobacteria bacterium]|nr:MAG: amidohydrolase [Actinomycetota bacterium]